MNPHYYIMKSKKILRLEENVTFDSLPLFVRKRVLCESDVTALDQNQANWRVVIFRDEIMELDEYQEWLASPEAMQEEEWEFDKIAN